jgi:hypothetical protein
MLHERHARHDDRILPVPAALDAGATVQDALVRRLRLSPAYSPAGRVRHVLEDRAPIAAVVGCRRQGDHRDLI